jgi:aminopeptidase N
LQASFEEASGKSLGAFFRQWLDRAGGPELVIADARAREQNGNTQLAITLEQKAPAYALDVPIEIAWEGKREVRWVRAARERTTETVELTSTPHAVRLDPEFRLWRRLSARELPPILREWIISSAPAIVIATPDSSGAQSPEPNVGAAAERLAQAFFEKPARTIAATSMKAASGPVLLVGLHDAIDRTLAALRLPPRPPAVANAGSAQVWTIDDRTAEGRVAVISARDAESLSAIIRPLPHYGAQSYLAFEGSKMVTRGVWPADVPAVGVVR